jgi:hypothetical protein
VKICSIVLAAEYTSVFAWQLKLNVEFFLFATTVKKSLFLCCKSGGAAGLSSSFPTQSIEQPISHNFLEIDF